MGHEKLTCLEEVIKELKELPSQNFITNDMGIEHMASGPSIRYKEREKNQETLRLKIIGEENFHFHPMYNVKCGDGCEVTALLYYRDHEGNLSKNKEYKVLGYCALVEGHLIIVAGETHPHFKMRLGAISCAMQAIKLY